MNSNPRCNTIYAAPKKPVAINGPATVCVNQQGVTYSVASAYGATDYLWTVPTGASIVSGQGTPTIVVNFGASAGSVKAQARNSCGNLGTRALTITMNCRTVIDAPIADVRIVPNPASQYAELIIDNGGDDAVVTLSNLLGKELYTTTYDIRDGSTVPLDLNGYAKGFYLVTVRTAGHAKTIRLVIE
jgi:hypothetical protein